MDCSTPGLPVPHHLPELAQVHGHCCLGISSSDALLSFCPLSFPASGTFPMSHLFASNDKNIGASASASVLPVNIQDWSLSRLTGLIFFLFKGLSRVFSGTTVQGHQFFDILGGDHLRPPVSGRKLDTEQMANRSQINKGNRFRKDWCNRLKSLKVTPTTSEGAYRYREV